MSLPTIEPLPDDTSETTSGHHHRRRRMVIPSGASERGKFLHDLSLRTVPTFDFYLFSLLAGLVLAAALLLDAPALYILAALIAPFMAPAIGISLGTVAGALRFVFQSLVSLIASSLIIFLCGLMAGWAASMLPVQPYQQAAFHANLMWTDFILLLLGNGLAIYLMLRVPAQKPLVASVAIAYELYLPVGVAGFGLSSGISGLWPNAMYVFLVGLVWSAFIGTLVSGLWGLRPLHTSGYVLSALYAMLGLALVIVPMLNPPALPASLISENPSGPEGRFVVLEPSATPSPVPSLTPSLTDLPPTLTATPTHTLLPTRTPTLTITPVPTPIWARINASEGGGALIRKEPNYNAPVLQSILNGTLVEVLPEVQDDGGVAWVHVRLVDGRDGWVVRGLLRTATPAPGW